MTIIRRFIFTLVLCLCVLSCDLLYFPVEGRNNIVDPKNELVAVNDLSLPVVRDGYIEDLDMKWFDDPVLVTQTVAAPNAAILIQFDISDLPMYVDMVELELFATPVSDMDSADVFLIAKPWDPATITWGDRMAADFIDWTLPTAYLDVSNIGMPVWCDVTEYVLRMRETGKNFGFLISSWGNRLEFDSSRAANPPKLRVWGWDAAK